MKGYSMEIIAYNKQINYIDTLELYYNFVSYDEMIEEVKKLEPLQELGEAGGRAWFRFPNYRLGIALDYGKTRRTNNYDIVIQYENHHLFYLPLETLEGLELPFSKNKSDYVYKRIDFAKIIQTPIDYTFGYGFVTKSWRQHPFNFDRKGGTVYLGERKNGSVYRIYDKSRELGAKKDYKKSARLKDVFGTVLNLYTFEYELRRRYLYGWGIHTLEQHKELLELVNYLQSLIYLVEDNDRNKYLIEQNRYDELEKIYISDYRGKRIKKPPKRVLNRNSIELLCKSLVRKVDNFIDNTSLSGQDVFEEVFRYLQMHFSLFSSLPSSPRLSVAGTIKLE
jgi:hypothetical protein